MHLCRTVYKEFVTHSWYAFLGMEQREDTINVDLIGHSYIIRFRDFMTTSPELRNLGFSGVVVHCVGVVGATLTTYLNIRHHFHSVLAYRPYLIFLHIWENDVGRSTNRRISADSLDITDELSGHCTSGIVIVDSSFSSQGCLLYTSPSPRD